MAGDEPVGPIEFGQRRLEEAGVAPARVETSIDPGLGRESFTVRGQGASPVRVVGGDATAVMYGLLELAERVSADGARTLADVRLAGTPFLADRGLNVFLTLPWSNARRDTDYDEAALVDPARWWFHDDDYWTTLLDQMAEARLNWLDLHGTWDISSTGAPNLYAYFVHSETFPEVGVSAATKAANLAQLNRVIGRAHARGVRVSVMSYEARLSVPHRRDPPYPADEATAFAYTRDAVERLIRGAPGLDAIGFRIGESGRGGDFFRCYLEAVERCGRDIPLITRSWVTRKEKVVPLARASSDFTVEIKYDGEQWAAPYPFAGGRVATWHSYSFEDYLSDSTTHDAEAGIGAPAPRREWPGHIDPCGERWPDQPYKIVWQVRANGTHRIFPFHEPEWIRRSIRPMKLGTASGFTIEPINAYFPASPDYYLSDPGKSPCRWIHQRDELYLLEWGRLGYDPETPDSLFRARLARRFGPAAGPLDAAWRAASRIVPLALLAHAHGPDHRDHAPELEWGGSTREWIEGEGLDTHAFRPIREEIALRATGGSDGRLGALDAAAELERAAETASAALERVRSAAATAPAEASPWLREHTAAVAQQIALGRYHAGRQRAAWWTALANAAPGTPDARLHARAAMDAALEAWTELSESEAARHYAPFTDRLRMRTHTFHWRDELPKVRQEALAIRHLAADAGAPTSRPPDSDQRPEAPAAALTFEVERDRLVASLPAAGLDRAFLLHKPLPSSTLFHREAMERDSGRFVARVARLDCGHLLAAEVGRGDATWRLPDPLHATPWLVVPARTAPTPLWFSTGSALDHLDPAALDPSVIGPLVIGPRAWQTFRDFEPTIQRKLLAAIERGGTLLLLQQDYTSGRYPLSWLPEPPKVENARLDAFDPGGALRLDVVRAPDIVTQRFVATPGWQLHGNGAVAHRRFGEGELWMVQARLIQHLELPSAARALLTLLRHGTGGVSERPVVLIDPGTENNRYGSSVLPDFMNAHGIPFLTLGEVIAARQGVAAAAPAPGAPWDDLILDGQGPARQQRWLEAQARKAAARPAPSTRDELEARQPAELLAIRAALGLDPLPPGTPLRARVTGVVQRTGYRIEKIVYESRPGFPVTAHLYVPTTAGGGPFPVILNPHGHWRHKKLEPVVQQRLIQQVKRGYVALIVDSPGFSFEGDARIERRYAGSHFDFRDTLGSSGAGAIYVWDLMRGLDYLETRAEADMSRVGITGASGGGHATLWTFAADPRIDCAVPVVFATSLEVMPHNGCACNHVPGTLCLGDRADVLAARAPAPVLVLGATDDREFPPAGTELTGRKLKERWAPLGAAERVDARVFPGPHDYNLAMVGHALGFFDRWLKGEGDGTPVELEPAPTEAIDDAELFCLEEVPPGTRTFRDLAREQLAAATLQPRFRDPLLWLAFNGGIAVAAAPAAVSARDERGHPIGFPTTREQFAELAGRRLAVSFESSPGLAIPGLLFIPRKEARGAVILVGDDGKARAEPRCTIEKLLLGGFACLALDPRGFGELDGIDLRLSIYLHQAPAVAAANDVAAAVALLRPLVPGIAIVGDGAAGSLTALAAGLALPELVAVIGRQGMREFADAFDESVPLLALQPQADRVPPLSLLRAAVVPPSHFTFRGDPGQDLYALLQRLQRK
jgi:dienelactone hydrolase